ncbi:MAG: phosphoserine phosphatase SerB [Gammaproteobacteria bacterium]|nr:phosphoserine phosphatase SerB [Gammaproteobacteria bacterium]
MAYLYIINSQLETAEFEARLGQLVGKVLAKTKNEPEFCKGLALVKIDEVELLNIRSQLDNWQCDYVFSELELKPPKLVVFDMDSTLIPIEVIDELAQFADKKAEVSQVTELAMQGQLDFNQSLRQRVKHLKGLEQAVIQQLAAELVFNPGVEAWCQYLIKQGSQVAIASGGFVPFAQALQQTIDFSFIRANQLAIESGKLTGEVVGTIINAEEKAKALTEWASELAIDSSQCMAIGDGANDLAMLQEAGIGLAYHAKPKVNQSASSVLKYASMAALIDLFEFAGSSVKNCRKTNH